MIWLFHRRGEYVSCEVRTCLENSGFELLVARSGGLRVEWYPDELQVERRWERLKLEISAAPRTGVGSTEVAA